LRSKFDGPYNNIKNWDYAGLMNVFTRRMVMAGGLAWKKKNSAAIDKAIAHMDRA